MNRFKYRSLYEERKSLVFDSASQNRPKFKSDSAYLNAVKKSAKFLNKDSNYDKYIASASFMGWHSYYNIRRHNIALFGNLLLKILVILAPIIIISVILYDSTNTNYQFDFFEFVSRFSKLQLNTTTNFITWINKNKSLFSEAIVSKNVFAQVLGNIGMFFANVELVTGILFTFIIDFISNLVALLGALIPSMSFN